MGPQRVELQALMRAAHEHDSKMRKAVALAEDLHAQARKAADLAAYHQGERDHLNRLYDELKKPS